MRWPSAWLTACSCALILAGCGGGQGREQPAPQPRLAHAVAQKLSARAESVARRLDENDRCSARAEATVLQREVIQAINAHRVPRRLQEPLLSAANGLVVRIGGCVAPAAERKHEREHGDGERKNHKHEKKHPHDND